MKSRILGAGITAVVVASGLWLYLLWPRWYGTEVLLPVTLGLRGNGDVIVDFPAARVRLDASNTQAVNGRVEMSMIDVRSVGVVWDSHRDPKDAASRLNGATVYLQLKTTDKTSTTGEALWQPVSISTTPVSGAINLRVPVTSANESAQLTLGMTLVNVPTKPGMPRDRAAAVLKVLPSGRYAIVALIAGGQRQPF